METFHGIGLWFAKKRADLVLLLYYNLDVLQVCHSLGVSAMGMAAKQTGGLIGSMWSWTSQTTGEKLYLFLKGVIYKRSLVLWRQWSFLKSRDGWFTLWRWWLDAWTHVMYKYEIVSMIAYLFCSYKAILHDLIGLSMSVE